MDFGPYLNSTCSEICNILLASSKGELRLQIFPTAKAVAFDVLHRKANKG